jgi:hypothetical protein
VTRVSIEPAKRNAIWSRARRDATGGTIRLVAGRYYQLLLFHELAHLARPLESASHGPEFCEIYLRLIFNWMGDDVGTSLEAGFKAQRVWVAPSAVPLHRICLRPHGAVQPSTAVMWRRRTTRAPAHRDALPPQANDGGGLHGPPRPRSGA